MVTADYINIDTKGQTDIYNITPDVERIVNRAGKREGIAVLTVIGSTGALTTLEFEPALNADLQDLLQQLIPEGRGYRHDATWGDDNGHSHLRSALLGTSFTAPVTEGQLELGTWQQIIFIELDHRPRQRKIAVKIIGE